MLRIPTSRLNRNFNFGNHGSEFAFGEAADCGFGDQVGVGNVAALAVDYRRVFTVEPGAEPSAADKIYQSVIYLTLLRDNILSVNFASVSVFFSVSFKSLRTWSVSLAADTDNMPNRQQIRRIGNRTDIGRMLLEHKSGIC